MAGGYLGGVISPTVIKGPSIGDAQTQTSMAGMPIPKFFGHCQPVAPTLIDGDKIARKVTRKSGGKGATTVSEQEGFIATRFFLVGEGAQIARIYRNGKLVYSTIAGDDLDAQSSAFASQMTIWPGGPTQGPSPALEAIHGVGNVNYYRKRLCFEVRDDDETQSGGAANQYRVEVIASGTVTTECSDVDWVHGYTGTTQTIFATAVYKLTGITAGWNNNLRRTLDGGRTWDAVDYVTSTGWNPAEAIVAVWHIADSTPQGVWYIAKADKIAVSYDNGELFTEYLTPQHSIQGRVFRAAGKDYAGAVGTTNTTIFQPLIDGDSDIDLGANYGDVLAIGDIGGNVIVSTSDGSIVRGTAGGDVVFNDPAKLVLQFADSGSVVIAACAGGYLRSTDAGANWIYHSVGTIDGVVYARGLFYPCSATEIFASGDGLTLASVDTYFADNDLGAQIVTDGYSVLATTQAGLTATLPAAYLLPDAPGWVIDASGNVVGGCVTRIDADAAIWSDIALELGARSHVLLPPQMNVAHMTDLVPGFTLGNASLTGADYMRTLCLFGAEKVTDLIERDDELYANRRGGAVVATFDEDDLLAIEEEDDDTRGQAVKGFKRLTVMYPDPANNYVPTPQTAPRTSPDVTANNDVTMECPIPFDADTMAQKADIMQKIAFMELEGSLKRNFRAQYSQWVCGDPIVFKDRRYMIRKASNDDSMVRFEYTYDRPSAYTSLAAGSNAPAPAPQTSNLKGPTLGVALNLPALRTEDNTPGMYLAASKVLPGWAGTDVYISYDLGESEQLVKTITDSARMGELTASVDVDGNDSSGLIPVKPLGGSEFSSVSEAQIAAGANGFAVTTGGVSEIGQFQTASETSNGDYDLTNVTRGEMETTAAQHYFGDRLVMLEDMVFLPIDVKYAGRTLRFRFVTRGTAAANNETFDVLYDPQFTTAPTISYYTDASGERYTDALGAYYYKAT